MHERSPQGYPQPGDKTTELRHGPVNSVHHAVPANDTYPTSEPSTYPPPFNLVHFVLTPEKLKTVADRYASWRINASGVKRAEENFDSVAQKTYAALTDWHTAVHMDPTKSAIETFRNQHEDAHEIETLYAQVLPKIQDEITEEFSQKGKLGKILLYNKVKREILKMDEAKQEYLFGQLGMDDETIQNTAKNVGKSVGVSTAMTLIMNAATVAAGTAIAYKAGWGDITDTKTQIAFPVSTGLLWGSLVVHNYMNYPVLKKFGFTDNAGAHVGYLLGKHVLPDDEKGQRMLTTVGGLTGEAAVELFAAGAGATLSPLAYISINTLGALGNVSEAGLKKLVVDHPQTMQKVSKPARHIYERFKKPQTDEQVQPARH